MSNSYEDKKAKLKASSEKYEAAFTKDLTAVTESATDWAGKLFAIGGGMLLSYLLIKQIIGKDKGGKDVQVAELHEKKSGVETANILLKSLTDKAALIVLELARQYIVKLLANLPEKDVEKDS